MVSDLLQEEIRGHSIRKERHYDWLKGAPARVYMTGV